MDQNTLAKHFKALHVPGDPLILTNVWDVPSATAIASLPATKALATASYAVAAAHGLADAALDLETNVRAAEGIAASVIDASSSSSGEKRQLPLSVDIQDAYGDELETAIARLLDARAVVGINLEDSDGRAGGGKGKMYALDEAVSRIGRVLAVARGRGVPDFVVNARCDALVLGGEVDEAVERGRAYLAAGATTVFVWGGSKKGGMSRGEAVRLCEAFGGRLIVSMRVGGKGDDLGVRELREIGVARISVGPALQFVAMAALKEKAAEILGQS